jgi:hypothetical protein
MLKAESSNLLMMTSPSTSLTYVPILNRAYVTKLGGSNLKDGRAVAQVVEFWLLISKPRVQYLVMRFLVDKMTLQQVLSLNFIGFPLLMIIPPFFLLIYNLPLRCSIALSTQHIIRSSRLYVRGFVSANYGVRK